MDTKELLKKVRKIEIKTRGLSNQMFSGEYHSAFKGRGMTFNEVREYAHGDEIRTIDWNVTARFNEPHVKVFEEERELTVFFLVDASASTLFGTRSQTKKEVIIETCALLAFSAMNNNDKVGALFFSNQPEKFMPPQKGKKHVLRFIRDLIEFEPKHQQTDINEAIGYVSSMLKKRSIIFIVSDFLDSDFSTSLKIARGKHDIVALQVKDPKESEIPNIGLVQLHNPESGKKSWVNTSSRKTRKMIKADALKRDHQLKENLQKSGVDFTTLETGKTIVKPLMTLFKSR